MQLDEHQSFDINILSILNREDTRTTVMIKNIPNKFTRDKILLIINQHFQGAYDLFILPTDSKANKNFGYAFINFIHSFYLINFYHIFNGKSWIGTNSKKICEISYSKIQGKSKIKKHYPQKIITAQPEVTVPDRLVIPIQYLQIFHAFHPLAQTPTMGSYFVANISNIQ